MSERREDSEQSLETIFKEHSEQILRHIRGKIANPDDAEDLTQEVFLRAQDALPKFRGDSKLSTWLSRIAANVCVDAGRTAARRSKRETVELSDDQHPPVVELNIIGTLLNEEQQGRLHEVLTDLPPDQLLLLSLRYSDQLTYKEIADVMGVQEWDIINHLRSMLSKINRTLTFKELAAEQKRGKGAKPDKSAALDGLVVTGKGSEHVYYNLGTLYLQKGLVEAAIREWRKAHELAPDFIEPCLAIADQYAATNRPAEAVDYLQDVVRDVKSPELHTRLGESYVGINDYRRAVYHCQQAIKLQPDFVRAYIILSKTNRRMAIRSRSSLLLPGDIPSDSPYRKYLVKSLSYLRKAFELEPKEPVIMAEMIRTMLQLGRIEEALGVCARVLAKYPDVPYVQYAAAQVYEAAGSMERATELYVSSIQQSENSWFRVRLVNAYNRAGKFDSALKEVQKLLALGEQMQYPSSAYVAMTGSYIGLGRIDDAHAAAMRAYEIGQEPIDSNCRLSVVLSLKGKAVNLTERLCREGISQDKHHLCFLLTLSRVHLLQGRVDEALTEAKSVLDLVPESPEAHLQLGLSQLAYDLRKEAITTLQRVLELAPGYQIAEQALDIAKTAAPFDPAILLTVQPRPHLAYCLKVLPGI